MLIGKFNLEIGASKNIALQYNPKCIGIGMQRELEEDPNTLSLVHVVINARKVLLLCLNTVMYQTHVRLTSE